MNYKLDQLYFLSDSELDKLLTPTPKIVYNYLNQKESIMTEKDLLRLVIHHIQDWALEEHSMNELGVTLDQRFEENMRTFIDNLEKESK
mgnify:FL=1